MNWFLVSASLMLLAVVYSVIRIWHEDRKWNAGMREIAEAVRQSERIPVVKYDGRD